MYCRMKASTIPIPAPIINSEGLLIPMYILATKTSAVRKFVRNNRYADTRFFQMIKKLNTRVRNNSAC